MRAIAAASDETEQEEAMQCRLDEVNKIKDDLDLWRETPVR